MGSIRWKALQKKIMEDKHNAAVRTEVVSPRDHEHNFCELLVEKDFRQTGIYILKLNRK